MVLCCRNIVQLRGVGAADLSDLVTMRESMFVVQVGADPAALGGVCREVCDCSLM
jgi:hypothetical protein